MLPDSYFAGLFDGEGYIRISKGRQLQLVVGLGMTQILPVQQLHERFGGNLSLRAPQKPEHKPLHLWVSTSDTAISMLKAVEPWCQTKTVHIQVAYSFQELLDGTTPRLDPTKLFYYEKMKELNRRGPN